MNNWQEIFTENVVRLIHHEPSDYKAWESFAIDDALAESVQTEDQTAVIRTWYHPKTVVLGIADSRLPYLKEASAWLKEQGYEPVVRNSGGLSVALDSGVLNISLLMAEHEPIGIHEGYEKMVQFIEALLSDWTDKVEAFEVVGSYCPGDYDLSIGGKKFAGISQRRIRKGMAIQIYLSVEADHQQRAELIRDFYKIAIQGEETRIEYPTVDPDTMEALETLIGQPIKIDDILLSLENMLTASGIRIDHSDLTESEFDAFEKRRDQMISRNEKALGDLFEA